MKKTSAFAPVLKILTGRYRTTMLGELSEDRRPPFQILIGTILSARSRDEVTQRVAMKLFSYYPTPAALARANPRRVRSVLSEMGFYNQKTKNIIRTARILRTKYRGRVPETMEKLLDLPGVGRKVANCVLVYAFNKPAIPVDTHVHRLSNRLGWVRTKMPEETEEALVKILPRRWWLRINELFVAHGKNTCLPRYPRCSLCPVTRYCRKVGV